jgi:hypothetical protein
MFRGFYGNIDQLFQLIKELQRQLNILLFKQQDFWPVRPIRKLLSKQLAVLQRLRQPQYFRN